MSLENVPLLTTLSKEESLCLPYALCVVLKMKLFCTCLEPVQLVVILGIELPFTLMTALISLSQPGLNPMPQTQTLFTLIFQWEPFLFTSSGT